MAETRIDKQAAFALIRERLVRNLDDAGRVVVAGVTSRTSDDTGALDASETYEVDRVAGVVRIGTPLLHGRFRELGTIRMPPEAAHRRTLDEDKDRILKALAGR